jgi:MoaA/NifB/PqqE/SkfB family radical SAM enzyme
MAKKKKTLKVLKQEDARPYGRDEHLDSGGMGKKRNLSDRFCDRPWTWMEIDSYGRVNTCCPAWLPTVIGNLTESSFEEVWNSDKAKELRKSILDGSFSHCVQEACPYIQSDSLPLVKDILTHKHPKEISNHDKLIAPFKQAETLREILKSKSVVAEVPLSYNLCYDESCNLRCPSCRSSFINFSDEETEEFKKRKRIQDAILQKVFSKPNNRFIKLNITGSGDPFGSKLFRELLETLDGKNFPGLEINLQTNGVLFTENTWDRMKKLHDNIMVTLVSFDAATEETYNYTRNGGNWKKLLENMYFICSLRADKNVKMREVRVDFVVQERNYQEMGDFVELITTEYPEVDSIYFSLITDWGTYPAEEFKKHAIWKKEHPDFDKFVKMLKEDTRISHPKVDLGNLSEYKK